MRAWRSATTCTRTAGPARCWPCSCCRPRCRRAGRRRRSRRWPIPGSGPRCWRARSSPTTTWRTCTWAGCRPGSRSSPGSGSPRRRPGGRRRPGNRVLDLLAAARLQVGAHLDRRLLADEDLAWLAVQDRQCAGSDGIYQGQHPHPRGYGAFARLAGQYLAAGPEAGYQQVARHLAASAADAYGLRDRGRIAPGQAADLCVIGPAGLAERATYAEPRAVAAGIDLVMVNGVIAWRDGLPAAGPRAGAVVS